MKVSVPSSGNLNLFNEILAVSKPKTTMPFQFEIEWLDAHWLRAGNVNKYFYRALHKNQPSAQDILDNRVIPADTWCTDSIYDACAFINGRNRAPHKGDIGIIAVFEAVVDKAVRPFNSVEHFITVNPSKVNAFLKIKLV